MEGSLTWFRERGCGPARSRTSLYTSAAQDRKRRGREETGSWHLARARMGADGQRVRAAAPGGPSGRSSSAVGRRARSGWPERGRVGRVAPRLPHHTHPPAPWRLPRGNTVPAPSPYGRPRRPPPVTTPRTRDRRGDLPARLSPARPPRHVVP